MFMSVATYPNHRQVRVGKLKALSKIARALGVARTGRYLTLVNVNSNSATCGRGSRQ